MFEKYIHSDIEQTILARFINNPNELFECPELESKHFIFEENGEIFNILIKLKNNMIPITPKNIADEAKHSKLSYII